MKRLSFIAVTLATALFANAQVLKTDFLKGYKVGDKVEKNTYQSPTDPINADSWNGAFDQRRTDEMPSPVVTNGLEYKGYPVEDMAVDLSKFPREIKGSMICSYSLTDNKQLYRRDSYYLAFLANIKGASGGFGELLGFDVSYVGNGGRGKLYVKRGDERGKFVVNVGARRAGENVQTPAFDFNKTHLFVLKMDFAAKTVSVFIDPELSKTEPKPLLTVAQQNDGEIRNAIRGIYLRHYRTIPAIVGSFRFANTWAAAIGK